MQTFLPYKSFRSSAKSLDRQRLGKQRLEVKQILRALSGGGGWANHPAVRMWKGCEVSLALYGMCVCVEWRDRGYSDSLLLEFYEVRRSGMRVDPWWLGWDEFHLSHQSNLVRKNPDWYAPQFPAVAGDLPYVWPVVEP